MTVDRADRRLAAAAYKARSSAYCPYSRYPVGAAVLTASGRIFTGCNVENASLGLSLCAERVAVFAAVAAGHRRIRAVAVAADAVSPCGACRQVMREFADDGATVILSDTAKKRGVPRRTTLGKLLPMAFDPKTSGLLTVRRRGS